MSSGCGCKEVYRFSHTVISHFFIVEIFSDGTRWLKICYLNIIPLRKIFSIEKFSHSDI